MLMNKQMKLSAVCVIIAMSLNGMKDDKKENEYVRLVEPRNIAPKTLVELVKVQHNPSDDMLQFVEGMFVHIQKTKPEMYKDLAGGIYSQHIGNEDSVKIQGK
jgi:hypothetical protein